MRQIICQRLVQKMADVVNSIGRFNLLTDMFTEIEQYYHSRNDIVVLDMPLLDTTQFKDSLGNFIADLVLQILSWMAEDERNRIRKRQREGIDVALQMGVTFERPKAKITEDFKKV